MKQSIIFLMKQSIIFLMKQSRAFLEPWCDITGDDKDVEEGYANILCIKHLNSEYKGHTHTP